ncbi:MAG: 3'-5' exonuclease [Desulfovibrio sp.]|jgi:DNA polymerase-3 subunit epsilon|nr:3'-5' exonuclease [Desulfovibrio sp.]
MEFCAIDVETANYSIYSICQIGIVEYKSGEIVYEWETLVNPQDYFSLKNIEIHGIHAKIVADAPTFPQIYKDLLQLLQGKTVVSHTHFDRISVSRAIAYHDLQQIECTWLDSTRIVRRTWPQFARRGYALKNVCDFLEYKFSHHNALADAKAAGYIVNTACLKTGITIDEWVTRVNNTSGTYRQDGYSSPASDSG